MLRGKLRSRLKKAVDDRSSSSSCSCLRWRSVGAGNEEGQGAAAAVLGGANGAVAENLADVALQLGDRFWRAGAEERRRNGVRREVVLQHAHEQHRRRPRLDVAEAPFGASLF